MFWRILAVMFLLSLTQTYAVVINEIMYNPIPSGLEWVEIYNNESFPVNLSGWKLFDSSNKTIKHVTSDYISSSGFAIITENSSLFISNHSMFNGTIFQVSSLSLSNTGETIRLLNKSGKLIDEVNYSSDWGGSSNYSLELVNYSQNNDVGGNWRTSLNAGGTPGEENSVFGISSANYKGLSISEFIPDPLGDDNAPAPNGEWIEIFNSGNKKIDLKWSFFKDLAGHTLVISDTTTSGTTVIEPNKFLVVYANGFSGLMNNNGPEELKFYDANESLIDSVSYQDSTEGSSWAKVDNFWQKTKPTPGSQNIDYSRVKASNIDISNILDMGSDKKAKFGQVIRVKLNVYKGDTTKNSISVYAEGKEKISKEASASLYTDYQNYSLTIPLQLFPNCDGKLHEGKYNVKVEGLEVTDEKSIDVEGNIDNLCQKVEVENTSGGKFSYNLLSYPDSVIPNQEFSSKVEIKGDGKSHDLEIWSYVYKGSTSISGDKESNKQIVSLPPDSSIIVDLKNKVETVDPGAYKLKIKIKKDDQKTSKEITSDINVEESHPKETDTVHIITKEQKPYSLSTIIFESSQRKAEKIIPYAIASVMSATVIFSILLNKGFIP